ncbi:MAG: hypothetical protein FWB80_03945, partial [Defluviitaleaceae bacterium]|nr:hypothetical protein [Defluviitaleaceae bacterium]
MAHKYQTLTTAIKQQYDYSLEMLREITEACPDEIWTKKAGLYPFWQQIYHAIYWTDYNIQESKDGEKIFSWKTEKKITHELNAENNISSEYSELIRNPSRLSRQNREKHGFSPPLRRDGFSLNS